MYSTMIPMGAAHAPIWRRMIDVSVPHDLHDSTILDYGCNQGGFLRMMYDRNPFRAAVGIDIARESVARADLLKGHRPIEYKVGDKAAALGRTFDFAFSHEVLYLLPDLAQHAADMKAAQRLVNPPWRDVGRGERAARALQERTSSEAERKKGVSRLGPHRTARERRPRC